MSLGTYRYVFEMADESPLIASYLIYRHFAVSRFPSRAAECRDLFPLKQRQLGLLTSNHVSTGSQET